MYENPAASNEPSAVAVWASIVTSNCASVHTISCATSPPITTAEAVDVVGRQPGVCGVGVFSIIISVSTHPAELNRVVVSIVESAAPSGRQFRRTLFLPPLAERAVIFGFVEIFSVAVQVQVEC